MGAQIPKQFIPLHGKPLLMWTIENIYQCDTSIELYLALSSEQHENWRQLCEKHDFRIPHHLVDGGATRFESVKKGLERINADDDTLVAIHDGVRPFVSKAVVEGCFQKAALTKAAIPVLPVTETLREINEDFSKTVDRNRFRLVQTPQVFQMGVLCKAYAQPFNDAFTDDASVVEALGIPISFVEGNRENIKITTPFDLKIAEILLP